MPLFCVHALMGVALHLFLTGQRSFLIFHQSKGVISTYEQQRRRTLCLPRFQRSRSRSRRRKVRFAYVFCVHPSPLREQRRGWFSYTISGSQRASQAQKWTQG